MQWLHFPALTSAIAGAGDHAIQDFPLFLVLHQVRILLTKVGQQPLLAGSGTKR